MQHRDTPHTTSAPVLASCSGGVLPCCGPFEPVNRPARGHPEAQESPCLSAHNGPTAAPEPSEAGVAKHLPAPPLPPCPYSAPPGLSHSQASPFILYPSPIYSELKIGRPQGMISGWLAASAGRKGQQTHRCPTHLASRGRKGTVG